MGVALINLGSYEKIIPYILRYDLGLYYYHRVALYFFMGSSLINHPAMDAPHVDQRRLK